MSQQPQWKMIANLGDEDPFNHGGYFIYKDETGVYPEEAVKLVIENESEQDVDLLFYTEYRFILDCCTYINGILSDNKFHPEHPAWFAQPEKKKRRRPQDTTYLSNVAECVDWQPRDGMPAAFCSADPCERARAYEAVGDYHGWENLDNYPRTGISRKEVLERYEKEYKQLRKERKR